MGFIRLLFILFLIYIGYKILRFSVLMYLAQKKHQKRQEPKKEGSIKVHYMPEKEKSKKTINNKEDDYTSYEEIN